MKVSHFAANSVTLYLYLRMVREANSKGKKAALGYEKKAFVTKI